MLRSLQTKPERLLGTRVARVEDPRLISGNGKFVGDISQKGMLYVDIVRSPYAHAKIKKIDPSKALALPGFVSITTGEDAFHKTKPMPQAFESSLDDYCLAVNEVVYYGQPVAAIVAESEEIARDAVSLVEVEYAPLEPSLNVRSACEVGSPTAHSNTQSNVILQKVFSYGDLDEIFSSADHIISDSIVFDSYSATPLETFGIVADYDKGTGVLTVIDNSQVPSNAVTNLSYSLSIPSNHVRVIQNDIGGGFGIKTALASSEILMGLIALKECKPVKWIETRSDHLAASLHGSFREYDVKVAVRQDGTILGLKVKAFEDAGAFVRKPFSAPISCLRAFTGPYRFRAFEYDLTIALTNKCPTGASRGNGKNHHAFMLEKMIDRMARELKLDPLQLRLKNLIQPSEFPYRSVNGFVYDSGNYPRALKRVSEIIGYKDFLPTRNEGKLTGIGLAIIVDAAASNSAQSSLYGIRPGTWGSSETVSMRMDQMGKVTVALCTSPQGQGHETIAAMITAEKLGIPIQDIFVFVGSDSFRNIGTPMSGTYSSRFASIGASAVANCANDLRKKILSVASSFMNESEDTIDLDHGMAISRKSGTSVPVAKIAHLAYAGNPDEVKVSDHALETVSTYSQQYGRNANEEKTNFAATYSCQAHAAIVEIDSETGKVKILRYVVVDDSGTTLNPIILEGQIHGGVFNGIAACLYERFKYDQNGQLLTSSFMDYLAPTSCEIPKIEIEAVETPSPFTVTGAKGVGESGALGAQPAIINAIEDALSSYDLRIHSSYVSPEDILRLLNSNRRQ